MRIPGAGLVSVLQIIYGGDCDGDRVIRLRHEWDSFGTRVMADGLMAGRVWNVFERECRFGGLTVRLPSALDRVRLGVRSGAERYGLYEYLVPTLQG